MFSLIKLNSLLIQSTKQIRQLSTPASSASFFNSNGFNGGLYIPTLDIKGKIDPERNVSLNYECPSMKSFQLPLTDIKITDVLKRHKFNLPEINENKEIFDPLLGFQIEQKLPETVSKNVPISCNKSLMSEIGWRKRMMNKHKRKKYLKKMFYVFKRRRQAKDKRYNNILALYRKIHEKKVEAFDPYKFITRELEKAKFFGYRCTDGQIYDQARSQIESIPTFDEKYFRKFVDTKLPVHLRPENVPFQDKKKD